jgi:hypothetical protein
LPSLLSKTKPVPQTLIKILFGLSHEPVTYSLFRIASPKSASVCVMDMASCGFIIGEKAGPVLLNLSGFFARGVKGLKGQNKIIAADEQCCRATKSG